MSICEYLWETKIIIRVTKTFVIFERFVFKEKIRVHPCDKNIRDIRAIRVQRKNPCLSVSIRVPKIFDSCSKKIRVQKKQSAQSHTPMQTQADHLYLICHARRLPLPSPDTTITITALHHLTTFLPFTKTQQQVKENRINPLSGKLMRYYDTMILILIGFRH